MLQQLERNFLQALQYLVLPLVKQLVQLDLRYKAQHFLSVVQQEYQGLQSFKGLLRLGRFNSSPIQGAANIPGSPEAKRIRRQRLEQVGLGAGFPLLFGGGAGSILGGGLGGLTAVFWSADCV